MVLGTPLVGSGETGLGGAVRKDLQNQFFRLLIHRSASLLARKTKEDKTESEDKKESEGKKKAKKEKAVDATPNQPLVSSLFSAVVQFRAQLSSLSYGNLKYLIFS